MKKLLVLGVFWLSACSTPSFDLTETEVYQLANPVGATEDFAFPALVLHLRIDQGLRQLSGCAGVTPENQEPMRVLFRQQKMNQKLLFESRRMAVLRDKSSDHVLLGITDDQSLAESVAACKRIETYYLSRHYQLEK